MERTTRVILGVIAVLFVWYLVADRVTPFTQNARVRAFVVPIVPEVSGSVANISVQNNTLVEPGHTLLEIDKTKYEIAVNAAQAALDLAGQEVGASTATVDAAQAHLEQAMAQLTNYEAQAGRILSLEKKGLVPRAQGDTARAELKKAKSSVTAARADFEKAKSQLGVEGQDNAKLRAALADLARARLDLTKTTLKAPSAGSVTDLNIDKGHYASAGKPLMTFIAINDIWLEAYLTENNLGRVKPGNEVEINFDVAPGRIISGKVVSTSSGASAGNKNTPGELAKTPGRASWLRDPQRFSVVIAIDGYGNGRYANIGLRMNSQASVIVYTGGNFLWNSLAWVWIRFLSYLSYAY